jgi:hypothetical protein
MGKFVGDFNMGSIIYVGKFVGDFNMVTLSAQILRR